MLHFTGFLPTKKREIGDGYVLHDLSPLGMAWWSDFVVINGNLVVFTQSTEEDFVLMNGKIDIINMATWERIGSTINHNFGHCNTVHYDDVNDILLIGDNPGTVGFQEALLMIYGFSNDLIGGDLDFNALDSQIIDVSDISKSMEATASCFMENNTDGKRNIVYVNGQFNLFHAKIILGMGSDDLGLGTFLSTTNDRFNGSFEELFATDYVWRDNANTEVTQGIDFRDGKIYTGNGHTNLIGGIWTFDENNIAQRQYIEFDINRDNGSLIDNAVCEGFTLYNNKILHGITANGNNYIVEYYIP